MTTADNFLMTPLSQSEQHVSPDDVTHSGPTSLYDLVITVYHFHGQVCEVATKLRPLQSQEQMHRLAGSGQAAPKLRSVGG